MYLEVSHALQMVGDRLDFRRLSQPQRVHGQEAPKQIKVPILNATGQDAGFATFKTVKKGVKVKIELKNIEFGLHAVHIHQNPRL